jgi:hypothetical protein
MAFPKYNVKLVLVDAPFFLLGHIDDDFEFERRIARCLYLPISLDKQYFDKIEAKQNEQLYLRIHDLPLSLRQCIPKIFKHRINKEPVTIVTSACVRSKSRLINDYLPSLKDLKNWYSKNTIRRAEIDEWIQLIQQIQSWSLDNPSTARLIYFSAFIMSFVHSKSQLKRDLYLVSW